MTTKWWPNVYTLQNFEKADFLELLRQYLIILIENDGWFTDN